MQGTIVRDMPPPPEEERAPPSVSPTSAASGLGAPSSPSSPPSTTTTPTSNAVHEHSVATLSNPWEYDLLQPYCTSCREEFNPINRRHHCRMCGKIFCNNCSNQRTLIPPSSIVLSPEAGKKAMPQQPQVSFSPDPDPDRMLTYLDEDQQLLYGKGLEERFQLAREPLRVCVPCYDELQPLQEELRSANSNAMRFNHVDPHDPRRFLNSPLAFTLGHEVRKAAYTLNNLLPLPKRMGSVIDTQNFLTGDARELQQCKEECMTVSPNLGSIDGVRIPARLLEQAKGLAVLTVIKGGFGLAGAEFGTGLAVARLGEQQWSAPCAIGLAGISWGALIGAQISDHVFLLMTDAAVEIMFHNNGNIQLGADIGVAVGPLGRALEADVGAAPGSVAPIYTYSLSKGLYAGISLDGKVIVTRDRVNEKFYGRTVSGMDILQGQIPTPPAARPLYDALQRCHVYATGNTRSSTSNMNHVNSSNIANTMTIPAPTPTAHPKSNDMEYGELPDPIPVYPPATNDHHSYAGMSDITSDPGY
mmetsp:Transcript_2965/g.4268  ORF Transcript_2965/g.4268 Transcript_2965/m.4268 type:complete len:530 (-) Transcript_2965:223-1812(-)